jgi:hypothetical protein
VRQVPRLPGTGPQVDGTAWVGFEDEDYSDFRWCPVAEIQRSTDRFHPVGLEYTTVAVTCLFW